MGGGGSLLHGDSQTLCTLILNCEHGTGGAVGGLTQGAAGPGTRVPGGSFSSDTSTRFSKDLAKTLGQKDLHLHSPAFV